MLKKKYPSLSFAENFLGGRISIGPVTIYGENAMHWGVNIRSKRYGYICFRLPFRSMGRWWPLYFYVSPNATPWAATFQLGGVDYYDRGKAALRRQKFGHNFNTYTHGEELRAINDA